MRRMRRNGRLPKLGFQMYVQLMTFAETDVDEAAQSVLLAYDRRVAGLPRDLCAAVLNEARTLETELLSIYRFIAIGVRNETEFENIARWWHKMKTICDDCLERLSALSEKNPECGIQTCHDRVLDVRNRCKRFADRHA
jgi:hypothetical protein